MTGRKRDTKGKLGKAQAYYLHPLHIEALERYRLRYGLKNPSAAMRHLLNVVAKHEGVTT